MKAFACIRSDCPKAPDLSVPALLSVLSLLSKDGGSLREKYRLLFKLYQKAFPVIEAILKGLSRGARVSYQRHARGRRAHARIAVAPASGKRVISPPEQEATHSEAGQGRKQRLLDLARRLTGSSSPEKVASNPPG